MIKHVKIHNNKIPNEVHGLQQYTFPNGFRLIYEKPLNSVNLTSIYVFCELGSKKETDENRGVSHFIEHMCFKGTRKIPQTKTLNKVYDEFGSYINAFTMKKYTCFVLKCQDPFVKKSVLVLSDMLMNSKFSAKDFEREKKVVVEENILNSDHPQKILENEVNAMIYKGSQYAFPVDTLCYHNAGSLQYKPTLETYKKFYRPENFVISIVSHLSFEEIIEIIKKSDFMRTCKLCIPKSLHIEYPIYSQNDIQYQLILKPKINTTNLVLAFRTCSYFSPDQYPLMLLQNIIGGSMRSSRLFTILRDTNGLTYTSTASTSFYEIMGDFKIYAEFDQTKLLKTQTKLGVLPLILQMLNDLVKHGITENELRVCKNNLKGYMLLQQEKSELQTLYNGEQVILFGKKDIISYSDYFETFLQPISQKQVNEIIKKYVKKDQMSVCIVSGKNDSLPAIKRICETLVA